MSSSPSSINEVMRSHQKLLKKQKTEELQAESTESFTYPQVCLPGVEVARYQCAFMTNSR
jgi:hypothetical protein